MSNHFDYMPKPDGWVSCESKEPATVEPGTEEVVSPVVPVDSPVAEKEPNVEEEVASRPEEDTPLEHFITRCANILSWIFVPLMMPVYGIILIFSLSFLSYAPAHTKWVFTLIVFGANFIIPMALVLLLKKIGMISDVGLNGREERLVPYIISILCLAGTGVFLYLKMAPIWVVMFYFGGALAALVNLVVNFRWKISAHAAGIAGIVAMLIEMMKQGPTIVGMTWWIVGSIIVAGLLGSARIWLGRHTLMQVLAGSAVGFLSVWTLSLL